MIARETLAQWEAIKRTGFKAEKPEDIADIKKSTVETATLSEIDVRMVYGTDTGVMVATRKQGYALSASKISNGLCVLAMPVRDKDGYPVAAVSVAAPSPARPGCCRWRCRSPSRCRRASAARPIGARALG